MAGVWAFLGMAGLVGFFLGGVLSVFARYREFGKSLAGTALIALIAGIVMLKRSDDAEARSQGFESNDERSAFRLDGGTDISQWRQLKKVEREKAELEKQEKTVRDARLVDEAKAKAAAAEKERQEKCRSEVTCWGEKLFVDATVACMPAVQNLAKVDYKWVDGLLEPKFSRYRWTDKKKTAIDYVGDAIQFQNGFGAWIRHTYSCTYDVELGAARAVKAWPGRIQN